MEKLKTLLIKYKWYVAGAVGLFIAIYLMRNSGGSSSGAQSVAYTTSTGQVANQYSDPTLLLAQNAQQGQLALQAADNAFNLSMLQENNKLASATIDANKWMAQLDSNTQTNVAQLGFDASKYTADIGVQMQNMTNQFGMYEIDAQKYITGLQINSAQQISAQQGQVELYKAKAEKHNANLNFATGLLGSLTTLGSKFLGNGSGNSGTSSSGVKSYNV